MRGLLPQRAAEAAAAAAAAAARRWLFETPYLWVGGAGSNATGLHSDDEDNVLIVTHGLKRVELYAPSARPHLHANAKYDSGTECCDLDMSLDEAGKARKFPRYAGCAPPLVFALPAGSALFIPADWYHAVTSPGISVSVNVFFSTPLQLLRRGPKRALLEFCHARLGLWRRNCVCH